MIKVNVKRNKPAHLLKGSISMQPSSQSMTLGNEESAQRTISTVSAVAAGISPSIAHKVEVDKSEDSFMIFLEKCAKALSDGSDALKLPKRVFDNQGNPIHTVHELVSHDTYFISDGEPFNKLNNFSKSTILAASKA